MPTGRRSVNWSELASLVDVLLDTSPERRASIIEEISAGDDARRAELEGLLEECEREPTLLGRPAAERFAELLAVSDFPASLAERYRLKRELGRGGMATVYLVHDLKHDRPVALKVLHRELAAALGPERFLREIRIAAGLHHPLILPVFDSGSSPGASGAAHCLWYTMPFVEGEALRDRLARESQLAIDEAVRIGCEVADALGYAHARGVIHRDVKPENILLSGGHALLADFGIARALSMVGEDRLTQTGLSLGTPAYMSPEQAAGDDQLDCRADLYSLACVLYEMLAGQPPFTAPSPRAMLARHAIDPVPGLRTVRATVPAGLEAAIRRALCKVPADRFGSAADLIEALNQASRGSRVEPFPGEDVTPDTDRFALTARLARTLDEDPSLTAIAALTPAPATALDPPLSGVRRIAPEPTVRAPPPRAPAPPPEPVPVFPNPGSPLPESSRRRWVVAGFIGLLVLGAIGLLGVVVRGVGSPDLPTEPIAIAILPFAYRGDPKLSYLSEGMADLLSARVDGAAGLRSIDQRALLTFLHRQGGIADSRYGRLAAERFGAGFFVLGSMVEAGGRLQMSATIYDERAKTRSSIETVAGSETEIFDAADRLARQILAGTQDRPFDMAGVAGQTTSSLPALKAYLEGERELRAGRNAEAQDAFRRATELDTTFALAYYRLAFVTHDPPLMLEALDHALRHSDRLAEHHRWIIEALAADLRGDHILADQRTRQVVTIRPDDAEGWFMRAVVTLGKAHLLGRAWVDSREAFERALALGPENAQALWWLAGIAATERRLLALDSLTDRLLGLDPDPWLAGNARGQRAIMMGDTAGEARFVAELRERPDPWAQSSAGVVTWMTGDLSAGRRLWRLITEPQRSRGFRVMAHVTLAKIELTNGRWDAARAELEALEALDAAAALEHRAFYALTRFLEPPPSELIALRDSLQRWDPSSARTEGDGLIAINRSAHPYFRLYLLGILSARLGEPAAALGYAAELERADRSSSLGVFAGDQGQFVRAEVAWQGGRREEALKLLDQARYWTTDSRRHENGDSPFFIQLHERFARAELLYERGRHEDALPWYRALSYDFLYTGPAHLRLAQIYERRGERQKAIEHYSRFLELWRSSDPALQRLVQQARDALARLR